jgi:biotin-(acetyl-CoA carboxylase) ligase
MKRYHQLAIQIMVYVAGRGVNAKQSRKYPTQFYVEFTKAEEIQFKELFEHYTAAFEKEYKLFEHAFIVKQKLFAKDSEGMEWDMLTEAEKEELREVYKRAEGMPAYSHHKSLRS